MASEEDAITRRSPSGVANIRPAALTPRTSTHRSASTVNNSTTSKLTTSVSASSTSVRASCASLVIGCPLMVASAAFVLLARVGCARSMLLPGSHDVPSIRCLAANLTGLGRRRPWRQSGASG